jgi:hypothetical protein
VAGHLHGAHESLPPDGADQPADQPADTATRTRTPRLVDLRPASLAYPDMPTHTLDSKGES